MTMSIVMIIVMMTALMMMIMMMRPPHCHVNHHSTLARPIGHVPHTSLCVENREKAKELSEKKGRMNFAICRIEMPPH